VQFTPTLRLVQALGLLSAVAQVPAPVSAKLLGMTFAICIAKNFESELYVLGFSLTRNTLQAGFVVNLAIWLFLHIVTQNDTNNL
jgi:hypothetical protein